MDMIIELVSKMPNEGIIVLCLAVVFLFGVWWDKNYRFSYRLQASRQLARLGELKTPKEQFYFLRGINPFVFEEMILTALKKKGHKIIRNKRYVGDGGIDGQCYINRTHHLIQAKRYRKHINPAHVQDFIILCNKRGTKGLFIHTGKTGTKSRLLAQSPNIEIISGQKLLELLLS